MILVDGHSLAKKIKKEIAAEVAFLQDNHDVTPHVAYICFDKDSEIHESEVALEKLYHDVGVLFSAYRSHATMTEKELLELIDFINSDEDVDGIKLQLPLPAHINTQDVYERIAAGKDVDCLNPVNGFVSLKTIHTFQLSLSNALLQIFKHHQIDLKGKKCAIVEKHAGELAEVVFLMNELCDVTVFSTEHKDLASVYSDADVLIIHADKANSVDASLLKKESIVIDLGYHKLIGRSASSPIEYKGDVKVNAELGKCSYFIVFAESLQPLLETAQLLNVLKAKRRNLN